MSNAAASVSRDIAARFHHKAGLVCPENSNVIQDLRDIASIDFGNQRADFAVRRAEILSSYGFDESSAAEKPFAYQDGIAIIPIHGMLVNRFNWSYSFVTGYNFIRSQMQAALADNDVKIIVYDVNSSGGVAAGCSELSDEIFTSRTVKPSLAVVDARCYSAAYFLASAATRVVATPSGGIGSIGVVAMHVDYSAMLSDEGLKVTFIFAGAKKVDGNPYQALSARAKAGIQRDVDYHYGLFVDAVARNRKLDADDVRATEAGCYLPPEALENDLIDEVATPSEAVSKFYNDCEESENDTTKIGKKRRTGYTQEGPEAMTPEEINAAIAAGVATGVTAALAAEKTRASGIRCHAEAAGREKLANHLADNTTMSIEEAGAILAASPKVEAPKPGTTAAGNGFAAAMDAVGGAGVGADGGTGTGVVEPTAEDKANELLGAYSKMTGKVIDLKPNRAA